MRSYSTFEETSFFQKVDGNMLPNIIYTRGGSAYDSNTVTVNFGKCWKQLVQGSKSIELSDLYMALYNV